MSRILLPLALALALAGCAPDAAEQTAIDRDSFIEAYVELRRAAVDSLPGTTFEARKEEILQRHGTSEEELREFVAAHADDPEYLAALWEEIAARVGSDVSEAAAPEADEPL